MLTVFWVLWSLVSPEYRGAVTAVSARSALLCHTAIYAHPSMSDTRRIPDAMAVCAEVANKAIQVDIDPVLAVTIAYHESRFRDIPSWKGKMLLAQGKFKQRKDLPGWVEQGPMQVKPKWHCPKGVYPGCDMVAAGLRHIQRIVQDNPGIGYTGVFARYKTPTRPDYVYGGRVYSRFRQLETRLAALKQLDWIRQRVRSQEGGVCGRSKQARVASTRDGSRRLVYTSGTRRVHKVHPSE